LVRALEEAPDALEFKLKQVLGAQESLGVEERRRAADAVLGIIALAPPLPDKEGAIKAQLMTGRIATRLALKEETVWARLRELRNRKRPGPATAPRGQAPRPAVRVARADPLERELLELLLAEPPFVAAVMAAIPAAEVRHPGLRRLLEGLYALQTAGEPPTLDQLRPRLESAPLAAKALELQDAGRANPDRAAWLRQLLARFRERRLRPARQELHTQLQATTDEARILELLRQLQNRQSDFDPGPSAVAEAGS
jgi:DNA primase